MRQKKLINDGLINVKWDLKSFSLPERVAFEARPSFPKVVVVISISLSLHFNVRCTRKTGIPDL